MGKEHNLAQRRQQILTALEEAGGQKIERNAIRPEHFAGWVDWAKANHHGIDFNPTCFSYPLADSGFTLAHHNEGVRRFWIEHCLACRQIGAHFGREPGTPAITNIWIPDGFKDTPVDRKTPRLLLQDSLDRIFAEDIDPRYNQDAVESKLFGLGSESYVVGSHEFYLGYAIAHNKLLCLDAGHYHPTETISDKISATLTCSAVFETALSGRLFPDEIVVCGPAPVLVPY